MNKIKQFYVIIFLIFYFLTNAQNLKFDNYTSKDGLISDEVYNLYQDQKGYIWLFTSYGTMKYNGKKFEQVLKNLPFNESFIYSFYENKNGEKWAANSNAKIFQIRNDSAFVVNGTENISQSLKESVSEILQIYVDDNLNIFVCTKSNSYKFIKSQNYKPLTLNNRIASDSILFTAMEFENKILVVCDFFDVPIKENLLKKNFMKIKYTNLKDKNFVYSFNSKLCSKPKCFKRYAKDIYFASNSSLGHINENNIITEISINSIILNYTKDINNHLWVACYNGGLYELDEHNKIINHYFETKTINDIMCDSENGLWISTDGYGLFHCKKIDELHFDGELGNSIGFIKKIENELFIANSTGDVFLVGKNEIKKIKSKNNGTNVVEPLDIIKLDNEYLISNRTTVDVLKRDKGFKDISRKNKEVTYAYQLKVIGGDSIIFLQRRGFCVVYKLNVIDTVRFIYKTNFCEIRNKKVLFATDNGVYELFKDKLIQPKYLKPTTNCNVTKIYQDPFNNFWFCTKGYGLFKLTNKNELIHYTVENGLPSNIIHDISFNTNHSILLSTNIGLFQSSKFKKWIEVYPEQVKSAFGFKNNIYFTTRDGLIIQKDINLIEERPIYFNLASVLINDNTINDKQIGNLRYDQNSLEFNFDIISFSSSIPDIIYQLNTEKKDITQNQQIIFQNLIPGNYTLTASLNHHKSIPIVIPFTIIPAFWQTTWFFGLCIVLSLLICIYSIWKIFKYYKIKENKKNEANRLITEYKLIALKAQINPHFMSNCLTAIQHLIISGKVDAANQYLAKFSLLVRQVLNFSSKPLVTLKEELEIAQLNIELEQLRFENRFLFEIVLDKKLDLNTIFVPPLILQPIIENAIWHGLIPLKKTKKAKLIVKIYIKEDAIFINIEDNGVGRKRSENSIGNLKESKGIDITKQRIFNLNDYYNTSKADLVYEDLFDTNNNAIGTRVIIVLPLNLQQKEE